MVISCRNMREEGRSSSWLVLGLVDWLRYLRRESERLATLRQRALAGRKVLGSGGRRRGI